MFTSQINFVAPQTYPSLLSNFKTLPMTLGGSPISLMIYVPDVDTVIDTAVHAGAKLTRPVEDQFYGDRIGGLIDHYGHQYVVTHVKDVTPEEMEKMSKATAPASK